MKECAICLEEVIGCHGTSVLKPCEHEFHSECIRKWHGHAEDLNCPMCRTNSEQLVIRFSDKNHCTVDLTKGFTVNHILNNQRFLAEAGVPEAVEQLAQTFEAVLDLDEPTPRAADPSEDLGPNGTSAPRQADSGTHLILQCSICGDQEDLALEYYCAGCQALYHDSCLRTLAVDVGDIDSWMLCVECQCELAPRAKKLIIQKNQVGACDDGSLVYSTTSATIFEGQLREKHSVRTEQMYRDLEALRQAKTEIQNHVRKRLDHYYNKKLIDRDQYTRINKQVSRELYQASGYSYNRNIDYDTRAEAGIRRHLSIYSLKKLNKNPVRAS
ncbi:Alcohol-sensitive RING finger protein 1 [Nakaseomyces bracarensis]|uniref:Alcohol-sensitive RING finger protein 1 n=1 Tax=Nakaseomyces bracarensis TaxID=273131 RepID=A0ABR4NYB9_9SACH